MLNPMWKAHVLHKLLQATPPCYKTMIYTGTDNASSEVLASSAVFASSEVSASEDSMKTRVTVYSSVSLLTHG